MDQRFTFNFPVYGFLLADGSGTMYFRAGEELFLPLFTDWKVVESYLKRSTIDGVSVIKLSDAAALRDFLENPPTGAVKCSADKVVVDPASPESPVRVILDRRALIADLAGQD